MRNQLENPMVMGEYYTSAPEATYLDKLSWVIDNGLVCAACAAGLRVKEESIDSLKSELETAFAYFAEREPETAREWVEMLLELDPYHDAFAEWYEAGRGAQKWRKS